MKIEDFYLKWVQGMNLHKIEDFMSDLKALRPELLTWTNIAPMKQGWYWAVPQLPEDAHPDMICVWCDDIHWSYGEQGRSASYYKKFAGPNVRPEGWDQPVCERCGGTKKVWFSTDVPGRAGPLINQGACPLCEVK